MLKAYSILFNNYSNIFDKIGEIYATKSTEEILWEMKLNTICP